MIETCGLLTSYLFNAFWQIGVVWITAYVIARMLKPFGPEIEYRIWVWSLALSVVVPAFAVCYVHVENHRLPGPPLRPITWTVTAIPKGLLRPYANGIVGLPTFVCACTILYLLLLAFRTLRFCCQIRSVRKLAGFAAPTTLPLEKRAAWRNVLHAIDVGPVCLLASPLVSSPITVSTPKPIIILPSAFVAESTLDVFTAAVAHECAHIRRRDYRKNLICELLLIVIAFHPLARSIKAHIARTREMICDAMVVRSIMDWQSYALALLEVASKLNAPGWGAHAQALGVLSSTDFEKRILMLKLTRNETRSAPSNVITAAAATMLLGVAILISTWTRLLTAQTNPDPTAFQSKPLRHNAALICTYYDDKMKGYDGTCGRDKNTRAYRCFLNENSMLSQSQVACESKVLKAEKAATRISSAPARR